MRGYNGSRIFSNPSMAYALSLTALILLGFATVCAWVIVAKRKRTIKQSPPIKIQHP